MMEGNPTDSVSVRCLRVAFVLALSALCAGCVDSRKEPSLELLDATLQTPDATYPLANLGMQGMELRGLAPDVRVQMALFSYTPVVLIIPDPRTLEVLFDAEGCFYQRDDGDRIPLATNAPERGVYRGEPAPAKLELALPPPLSGIVVTSHNLPGGTIRAIEAISGERHRIYIPFAVDGEPYAIDASFELDVDRVWYWSAPGTP